MLKANFENKVMTGEPETKDLIDIEGQKLTRLQARQLREELQSRLATEIDRREYKSLTDRIEAINRALK